MSPLHTLSSDERLEDCYSILKCPAQWTSCSCFDHVMSKCKRSKSKMYVYVMCLCLFTQENTWNVCEFFFWSQKIRVSTKNLVKIVLYIKNHFTAEPIAAPKSPNFLPALWISTDNCVDFISFCNESLAICEHYTTTSFSPLTIKLGWKLTWKYTKWRWTWLDSHPDCGHGCSFVNVYALTADLYFSRIDSPVGNRATDTYCRWFWALPHEACSVHHDSPTYKWVVGSPPQTHRSGWCSGRTLPYPGAYRWA